MSRAETITKLPLATFAKILGLHPLHFEQVRLEGVETLCHDIYFQWEWQNSDHVGREEMARVIAEAEEKIEQALGYRLAPTWERDEWIPTVRPYNPEFINYNSRDIRGFNQLVRAKWGWFISGGIRSQTLIEAGAAIIYTDVDGDGYDETATVIVATTFTDIDEIKIFYPGESGSEAWEIRPTKVSISGGNATIIFRRELVVIPEKLDLFDIAGAEALGTTDADFLDEVDVYRRYNDPQLQATFLWEPWGSGCGACSGEGCSHCAYSTQNGCLMLRSNPRSSLVVYQPATWNEDDLTFDSVSWAVSRQPDIARLYYYSGFRDKSSTYPSRMAKEWEPIVAHMAAAMLDRPPCDCSADVWRRYRQDLSLDSGDEDGLPIFRTPSGLLDNPFGPRRGEVDAWKKVRSQIIAQGILV